MYTINKITSDHVIDFAAEELKKYLRMMMPECGEITVKYAPEAKDGFRLGLMADFGLDASEAEDLVLDDILHIDTDTEGGIIAGSNHRSVLLSVYRYLRENGCRWLFPGIDGEYIPISDVKPTKYHKMADCRYRGQCNEGAEFQQNMMDAIDFTPKLGMNVFMLEYDNPAAYYNFFYNHSYNKANREPEPVTPATVKQWKRQCEAEIAKRGLQFHDMGHGWTAEPFGLSSVLGGKRDESAVAPEETCKYLAQVNGKRGIHNYVARNTQFCMSNPEARTIVAKYVVNYAKNHQNADYLHVWLADGNGNHCECDECRKKTPSDWYVMLLNEIDERLSAEELDTRIVFICYTDTTWAPTVERLNNRTRFSFMLAAVTRTYTACVPKEIPEISLRPFVLNDRDSFPKKVEEYIAHAKKWLYDNPSPSLVYEYHFWLHQYRDPGMMEFSKLLYDDVRGYRANGFDGIIQDGSQRSYFPNGLNFHIYAETLFDTNTDYEAFKKDYLAHAYGDIADTVESYLCEITEAFDMAYIMEGVDGSNNYVSNKHAEKLRKIKDIIKKYAPVFEEHKNMPYRAQTVAMRLLRLHTEFCEKLAGVALLRAVGADPEARDAFVKFYTEFGKYEIEIGTYFDQRMCFTSLAKLIGMPNPFYGEA